MFLQSQSLGRNIDGSRMNQETEQENKKKKRDSFMSLKKQRGERCRRRVKRERETILLVCLTYL